MTGRRVKNDGADAQIGATGGKLYLRLAPERFHRVRGEEVKGRQNNPGAVALSE